MNDLLRPTPLLDFEHPRVRGLLDARAWRHRSAYDRVGAAYRFVKDEVPFGYNRRDALPSSAVLEDGFGQCNTKAILLMALLRGLGIPCRLHGFRIDNALQRGAIPTWLFPLAPDRIVHSWVEVRLEARWLALEGFILDAAYLDGIRRRFPQARGRFVGYGVATPCLEAPAVEWRGEDTFIQREGIVEDLGLFEDPDPFFAAHPQALGALRGWLYARVFSRLMTAHVARLRGGARRAGRLGAIGAG